jgi:hypothetical protein
VTHCSCVNPICNTKECLIKTICSLIRNLKVFSSLGKILHKFAPSQDYLRNVRPCNRGKPLPTKISCSSRHIHDILQHVQLLQEIFCDFDPHGTSGTGGFFWSIWYRITILPSPSFLSSLTYSSIIGHCLVALLGKNMAQVRTQRKLAAIFPSDKILCEAANWPDYIKYRDGYQWTYEHHFMPTPDELDHDAMSFDNLPRNEPQPETFLSWCFRLFISLLACLFDYIKALFKVLPNIFSVAGTYQSFQDDLGESHTHSTEAGRCVAFNLATHCPKGICILTAMANHTKYLEDKVSEKALFTADSVEALKFLIHYVGDSHQVLHLCNILKGGNLKRVTFNATKTDLHTVWDTDIVVSNAEKFGSLHAYYEHLLGELNRLSYLQRYTMLYQNINYDRGFIFGMPKKPELDANWYVSWASEIHCKYGAAVWNLPPLEDDLMTCGYLESVGPIITELLMTAGLRLAFILDTIFG